VIHSEMRWEVLGGFRWSGVTGPQKNSIVFVDEGYEFIREAVAPAQVQVLVDNLGIRPHDRGELPNVDVLRTVPRVSGLFQARIRVKEHKRTRVLG
jgi:hypothetical protein